MSILKKPSASGKESKRPAGRVVLSDLAVSIRYESETLTLDPTKFDPAEKYTSRRESIEYQSESDAVNADRRRAEQNMHKRLSDVEKELASRRMLHCSLDDIERIQTNLIDELDVLREVDPETGELVESQEYTDLEYRLEFMLDVCECLFQKRYMESIFGTARDDLGKRSEQRRRGDDNRIKPKTKRQQKASCFSGMYNRLFRVARNAKCLE